MAEAVAFSPNVASDFTMCVVSSATENTMFQMYSLSTKKWNTPFDISPVNIESTGNITGTQGAALTLAPDFLGGDDTLRVSFVGLYTDTDEAGVYRIKNTTDKDIYDGSDYDIWSIDYDGTNLVAGSPLTTRYTAAATR
jgi:hypothetical protein